MTPREKHSIIMFLKQCYINDWILDADDIKHILELDFKYVVNQYQTSHAKEFVQN